MLGFWLLILSVISGLTCVGGIAMIAVADDFFSDLEIDEKKKQKMKKLGNRIALFSAIMFADFLFASLLVSRFIH